MAPLSPAVEMKYLIDYRKVAAGRHRFPIANQILSTNTTTTRGYFNSYGTQKPCRLKSAEDAGQMMHQQPRRVIKDQTYPFQPHRPLICQRQHPRNLRLWLMGNIFLTA